MTYLFFRYTEFWPNFSFQKYLDFWEIQISIWGIQKIFGLRIFRVFRNLNHSERIQKIFGLRNIWLSQKSQSEGLKKLWNSKIQKYLDFWEIQISIWGIQKIFGLRIFRVFIKLNHSERFKKYLDSEIFDWVKNLNLRDSKNYEIQKSLTESKILNLANCRFKKYLNSEIFDGVQFQNLRHSKNIGTQKFLTESKISWSIWGIQKIFGLKNPCIDWWVKNSQSDRFKKYLDSEIFDWVQFQNLRHLKNIGTQKFLTESKISWSIWGIQKIFGPRNSWVSQKFSIWLKTFFQKTKIIWCERAAK